MSEQDKLVKAYCDGASMAYRDVADKMESTIKNAPKELLGVLDCMLPFVQSLRNKAVEVYNETERFKTGTRQ